MYLAMLASSVGKWHFLLSLGFWLGMIASGLKICDFVFPQRIKDRAGSAIQDWTRRTSHVTSEGIYAKLREPRV
jgi:hypothetical protein